MMLCKFIDCNKCTKLVVEANKQGEAMYVKEPRTWGSSDFFSILLFKAALELHVSIYNTYYI